MTDEAADNTAARSHRISPAQAAARLADSAFDKHGKPALIRMLECMTDIFDAEGCVIWEADQLTADTSRTPPVPKRLFALAAWFRCGEIFAVHDLKVDKSITGLAVLQNKTHASADILNDPKVEGCKPTFAKIGIETHISSPVVFNDGKLGAVTVYRKKTSSRGCFKAHDKRLLSNLASVVSAHYQAIRDRRSLKLINDVSDILNQETAQIVEAPSGTYRGPDSEGDVQKRMGLVCQRLAEMFHSLEASIFLADPLKPDDEFPLAATTWTGVFPDDKKVRHKRPASGMTDWVLHHARPVLVYDLAEFKKHIDIYQKAYPNLTWTDSLNILEAARTEFGAGDQLPPIGCMATPILANGRVAGVVRCSAGKREAYGTYLFETRDLALLGLVAAQIGKFWANQQAKLLMQQWEVRAFADLAHQMRGPLDQLQARTEKLMASGGGGDPLRLSPIRALARKTRRVTRSIRVLATAEHGDIRLHREEASHAWLSRLLRESAEDNQFLVEHEGVQFKVNEESFQRLPCANFYLDKDMLEQAIDCLLDNAAKYSFPHTRIDIFGGLTRQGNLHITVANKGIPIHDNEKRHCLERGYRTEKAQMVTGEGSGIGLWIADKIMNAHRGVGADRGSVEIVPTNNQGVTEIKLILPPGKVSP